MAGRSTRYVKNGEGNNRRGGENQRPCNFIDPCVYFLPTQEAMTEYRRKVESGEIVPSEKAVKLTKTKSKPKTSTSAPRKSGGGSGGGGFKSQEFVDSGGEYL
jgi:hypothetical protein